MYLRKQSLEAKWKFSDLDPTFIDKTKEQIPSDDQTAIAKYINFASLCVKFEVTFHILIFFSIFVWEKISLKLSTYIKEVISDIIKNSFYFRMGLAKAKSGCGLFLYGANR